MIRAARHPRHGSAIVVVLWGLAVAALVTGAVQMLTYRQATLGQEALARVQARWAARAGIEHTIAVMVDHTERPDPSDAYAMLRHMEAVATGDTISASYDIRYFANGREYRGPLDEHSRININGETGSTVLLALENMTFDTADAILDWIDEDDEENFQGAEREYYLSFGYQPRNGPMRNIIELEPVAGVWPEFVRGEDWNLNNRLDPSENDGHLTDPEDDRDGLLRTGWAGHLTTYSLADGATLTGLPRLWLRMTTPEELAERIGVEVPAARAILTFFIQSNNSYGTLIGTPLENIDPSGRVRDRPVNPEAGGPLTREQFQLLVSETTRENPLIRRPGKLNINTVSLETLRLLFPEQESIADELIYLRNSRPEGLTSLADLQNSTSLTPDRIAGLADVLTTTSNVYTISSRGRSWATGVEVEIIAVVDRSTLPVRILEWREQ